MPEPPCFVATDPPSRPDEQTLGRRAAARTPIRDELHLREPLVSSPPPPPPSDRNTDVVLVTAITDHSKSSGISRRYHNEGRSTRGNNVTNLAHHLARITPAESSGSSSSTPSMWRKNRHDARRRGRAASAQIVARSQSATRPHDDRPGPRSQAGIVYHTGATSHYYPHCHGRSHTAAADRPADSPPPRPNESESSSTPLSLAPTAEVLSLSPSALSLPIYRCLRRADCFQTKQDAERHSRARELCRCGARYLAPSRARSVPPGTNRAGRLRRAGPPP